MYISKQDMTQAMLKEYFDYFPDTGHLVWKKKSGRKVVVGNRAGSVAKRSNHRVINFCGCVWAEHRLIWLWWYGEHPKYHIDHINHNELDNRIENLRDVPQAINNMNISFKSTNTTGVMGVWITKTNGSKKFCAEISCAGVRKRKCFSTFEEATTQRKLWETELGFHENHGIAKPQ